MPSEVRQKELGKKIKRFSRMVISGEDKGKATVNV